MRPALAKDSLKPDSLKPLESLLPNPNTTNPWIQGADGTAFYAPDTKLLERLLDVPVKSGSSSESGKLAKSLDFWIAHELRRSGFPPDEIYPRQHQPRVMPRELGLLVSRLNQPMRDAVMRKLLASPTLAPSESDILGQVYVKQVDVVMSQWARGPEILISTKSMVSSFRKNLPNRFEESYGDAKNLRGRHPLAAMGFVFLLRSTALSHQGVIDKAVDMLRKLRGADAYDATSLMIADLPSGTDERVEVLADPVPPDLQVSRFLASIVESVLDRTPIDHHKRARKLRDAVHHLPASHRSA